ncbi:hypothetical protein BOX30_05390 [Leptospirillum ferriphilum]|nr:hypothetical protein BOX30_05390 [Leptospirillum ferriphilum]
MNSLFSPFVDFVDRMLTSKVNALLLIIKGKNRLLTLLTLIYVMFIFLGIGIGDLYAHARGQQVNKRIFPFIKNDFGVDLTGSTKVNKVNIRFPPF